MVSIFTHCEGLGYLQRPRRLTPWKEPRWFLEQVWAVLGERNSIGLLGFGPRNVQPVASCYTDCTFPTPSSVTKDLLALQSLMDSSLP